MNDENINKNEILMKKFNWGAFLLTWIWLFRYKKYLLAVIFIILMIAAAMPVIGLIVVGFNFGLAILAGIKGNEWALNARNYKDTEEFNYIQKKWTKAGTIVWMLIILSITSLYTFEFLRFKKAYETTAGIRRTATMLSEILKINDIDMIQIPQNLDSKNITQYFYASMGGFDGEQISDDTIKMTSNNKKNETTYKFTGNGQCTQKAPCTILVDINGSKKPNKLWTEPKKFNDQYEIPLILSEDKTHFEMGMPEILKKIEQKLKENFYKGREELNPDNY